MKSITLSSSPYVKQQKKKEFQNGNAWKSLKKLEKAWKRLKRIEKYLKL